MVYQPNIPASVCIPTVMFVHVIVVFLLMYSLSLCFLRRIPTRNQKEKYALGVVTLFPSLKDPFSKKGHVSILNLCIVYYICLDCPCE